MILPVAPSLHPETLPLDGNVQTTFEVVVTLVVAFALGTLAVLLSRAVMEWWQGGSAARGGRRRPLSGLTRRAPRRAFPALPALRPRRGPAV